MIKRDWVLSWHVHVRRVAEVPRMGTEWDGMGWDVQGRWRRKGVFEAKRRGEVLFGPITMVSIRAYVCENVGEERRGGGEFDLRWFGMFLSVGVDVQQF